MLGASPDGEGVPYSAGTFHKGWAGPFWRWDTWAQPGSWFSPGAGALLRTQPQPAVPKEAKPPDCWAAVTLPSPCCAF